MAAEWLADRLLLRQLLQQQPGWTNQQLAEEVVQLPHSSMQGVDHSFAVQLFPRCAAG